MKKFDDAFGQEVVARLETLAEDAQPRWGAMNRGQLFGHLNIALRYTLGEGPELPFKGNLKTRYIFRYIIMLGLKDIPHNIPVPRPRNMTREALFPTVPLETLQESIADYVEQVGTGALSARTHPYFGSLSASEWQRFHRLHYIHHLRQFGVGERL